MKESAHRTGEKNKRIWNKVSITCTECGMTKHSPVKAFWTQEPEAPSEGCPVCSVSRIRGAPQSGLSSWEGGRAPWLRGVGSCSVFVRVFRSP